MQIGDVMKSYSNKIMGTAALQCDDRVSNDAHIIDFEFAQKSRYSSKTHYVASNTPFSWHAIQRIQKMSLFAPFAHGNKQQSSLIITNKKNVVLYTGIIAVIFIASILLFG